VYLQGFNCFAGWAIWMFGCVNKSFWFVFVVLDL